MSNLSWVDEFGSDDREYKFDWNEDHSSWRLEDIIPLAQATNELLLKNEDEPIKTDSVYDLIDLRNKYSNIHHSVKLTSDEIVTVLKNLDEVSLSYDTLSMDTSFEYDCLIDNIYEVIDSWCKDKEISYTDEDWDIDPEKAFRAECNSRNGLGDHWKITFNSDMIILPSGTEIKALKSKTPTTKTYYNVIENSYCADLDHLGYIAEGLQKLSSENLNLIDQLAEPINNEDTLNFPSADLLKAFIKDDLTILNWEHFIENVSVIGKDWNGSDLELVQTCKTL